MLPDVGRSRLGSTAFPGMLRGVITVRELRKAYDARVAVDGVSFEIGRGETFGLLGPNGAGKSTTIHCITGVVAPDSGSVLIDGRDGPSKPAVRRALGLAPQALALYLDLSAEENVRFFGRIYGLAGTKLEDRTDWVLALAGLSDRRKDVVSSFSGGMQRRLNLACALVHDPPVILLDEPTVGVDPQSRNHLFDSIETLAKEGRTILYTTHYMEEAERLCDRVAIMDAGRILALDTVDGLVASHGGPATIEAELEEVPADAPSLPGRLDGRVLRFESEKPLEDAARLVSSGVRYRTLNIRRSDLESVFLRLTGRSLRD